MRIKSFLFSLVFLFSSLSFALDLDEAAHLLRRAEFGPTTARLDAVLKKTKVEAANSLFLANPQSSNSDFQRFINLTLTYEQGVQTLLGQLRREQNPLSNRNFKIQHKQLAKNYFNSVIRDIPLSISGRELAAEKSKVLRAVSGYKIQTAFHIFSEKIITFNTLQNWWIKEVLASQEPIREMMTLFWYGYFYTTFLNSKDIPLMALQHYTLRNNALGSFKTMVNEMHAGVALLYPMEKSSNRGLGEIQVDDIRNSRKFSKILRDKLLNLTVGLGYNLQRSDKRQARKALTGYTFLFNNPEARVIAFNADKYKGKEGTFFNKKGLLKKQDIINALMESEWTAKNVVEHLWLFFVSVKPDSTIVNQWARSFQAANYDIKNLLVTLFSSTAFYDHFSVKRSVGSKSFAELIFGTAKALNISAQNLIDIKSSIEPLSLGTVLDKITKLPKQSRVPLAPADIVGGGDSAGQIAPDSTKRLNAINAMLTKSANISSWPSWARAHDASKIESVLGTVFFSITTSRPVLTYPREGDTNAHYENWLKKALTDFLYTLK